MYITTFDMTVLATRVRDVEPKPGWDLSAGWPAGGAVWRVEPLPKHIGVMQQMGHSNVELCMALRTRFDDAETAPWAFVPGDRTGEIWLVKADAGAQKHNS